MKVIIYTSNVLAGKIYNIEVAKKTIIVKV